MSKPAAAIDAEYEAHISKISDIHKNVLTEHPIHIDPTDKQKNASQKYQKSRNS